MHKNYNIISQIGLSYEKIKSHEKIKLPLAGTNPFMSPEVLSKAQIDIEDASKIDMFSLGVMLFNLSIGDFPYNLNVNHKKNYDEILFICILSDIFDNIINTIIIEINGKTNIFIN